MADKDETKLTEEAKREVRDYLWWLFKRGAAALGIVNIAALLAGYLYVVREASDSASKEASTKAEDRIDKNTKIYEELIEKMSGSLERVGQQTARLESLEQKAEHLSTTIKELSNLSPENVKTLERIADLKSTEASPLLDVTKLNTRIEKLESQPKVASYIIKQPISFPYSTPTRVNFDTQLTNTGFNVQTGIWQMIVPQDGFYLVAVHVRTDALANLRFSVRTSKGTAFETPPITDSRSAVTATGAIGVVQLAKGEALWVEATHSQHAKFIVGGEIAVVSLR